MKRDKDTPKNSGPNRNSTQVDDKQECWGDCTSQMDETTAKKRNLTAFPNLLLSKNLQFPWQFHLLHSLHLSFKSFTDG